MALSVSRFILLTRDAESCRDGHKTSPSRFNTYFQRRDWFTSLSFVRIPQRKAEQLRTDVLSWFSRSKDEPDPCLDFDVSIEAYSSVGEKILDDCMPSLNVEADDGSVEKIVNDNEDCDDEEDEDDTIGDDNSSNMTLDEPQSESNLNLVNAAVYGPGRMIAAEPDDGWVCSLT